MSEKAKLSAKFWIETALAAATGVLAVVTAISREWIEFLFGVDPDQGSGLVEWGIVIALAAATVLFGVLARAEWRHAAVSPSPPAA